MELYNSTGLRTVAKIVYHCPAEPGYNIMSEDIVAPDQMASSDSIIF